jgi:hypothetical protein
VAGLTAIYFTQVRIMIVSLACCIVCMTAALALQGNVRIAGRLAIGAVLVFAVALIWAGREGGSAILDRFATLVETDPRELYHQNRGRFALRGLEVYLPSYPMGAGLGRYGIAYGYFGTGQGYTGQPGGGIWCETQIEGWIIDGGFLMLIAYPMAILMALWSAARVMLTSPDRRLAYWAVVVGSWSLSVLAMAFSGHPFAMSFGIQFWALNAALHAADQRARLDLRRARAAARGRPARA